MARPCRDDLGCQLGFAECSPFLRAYNTERALARLPLPQQQRAPGAATLPTLMTRIRQVAPSPYTNEANQVRALAQGWHAVWVGTPAVVIAAAAVAGPVLLPRRAALETAPWPCGAALAGWRLGDRDESAELS